MGTETSNSDWISSIAMKIWRYSPRNGDGNYGKHCTLTIKYASFGDIVPGMGTETDLKVSLKQSLLNLEI